jgi:hypothetical protein
MLNERVFRPSIGTQMFLGAVWFAFFLASIYAYIFQSLAITYVLVSGLVLLIYIYWVRTVSISVSPEVVTHRSGFGREASLMWHEIQAVTTSAELQATNKGLSGKYLTTLRTNNPSKKDLKVNIKLFSKRDLMEFASTILDKARNATIDNATKAMSQGQMPSAFGFKARQPQRGSR